MDRREVERLARESGPWTDRDTARAKTLREHHETLTASERQEMRVLRQREINEAVRLRRLARGRRPAF